MKPLLKIIKSQKLPQTNQNANRVKLNSNPKKRQFIADGATDGKRTTTKLPKEVTVAKQQKEAILTNQLQMQPRFTVVNALVGVGTVKLEDAWNASMWYVVTAVFACAWTVQTMIFCVVATVNVIVVDATSIVGRMDGLAMIATNGIVMGAGMVTMIARNATRAKLPMKKQQKMMKLLKRKVPT